MSSAPSNAGLRAYQDQRARALADAEGLKPGSARMLKDADEMLSREAANISQQPYGKNFDKEKTKLFKEELTKVNNLTELTDKFSEAKTRLTALEKHAQEIEASERAFGRDPNQFLGAAKGTVGEKLYNAYDRYARIYEKEGDSPAAARIKAKKDAVRQFRQELQNELNQSGHELSGAALSPVEKSKIEAFASAEDDFGFLHNFIRLRSASIEGRRRNAINSLEGPARLMYLAREQAGKSPDRLPIKANPGPAKAPEPQGEYNAGRSQGTEEPLMSVDPRVSR